MWHNQLTMASITTFWPFTEFLHEVWLLSPFTHSKMDTRKSSLYAILFLNHVKGIIIKVKANMVAIS